MRKTLKSTLRSILFLSLFGLVALGCSKTDEAAGKPVAATTESAAVEPEPKPTTAPAIDAASAKVEGAAEADHGVWEQYWPEFRKAASVKDMDALRALTAVGDGNDQIDEGTFESLGDMFLTKEVIDTLVKTDATGATVTKEDDVEIHEFSWSETAMVDGEEMGSGLFFYFKKIDGKYRLFRLLAAG